MFLNFDVITSSGGSELHVGDRVTVKLVLPDGMTLYDLGGNYELYYKINGVEYFRKGQSFTFTVTEQMEGQNITFGFYYPGDNRRYERKVFSQSFYVDGMYESETEYRPEEIETDKYKPYPDYDYESSNRYPSYDYDYESEWGVVIDKNSNNRNNQSNIDWESVFSVIAVIIAVVIVLVVILAILAVPIIMLAAVITVIVIAIKNAAKKAAAKRDFWS